MDTFLRICFVNCSGLLVSRGLARAGPTQVTRTQVVLETKVTMWHHPLLLGPGHVGRIAHSDGHGHQDDDRHVLVSSSGPYFGNLKAFYKSSFWIFLNKEVDVLEFFFSINKNRLGLRLTLAKIVVPDSPTQGCHYWSMIHVSSQNNTIQTNQTAQHTSWRH